MDVVAGGISGGSRPKAAPLPLWMSICFPDVRDLALSPGDRISLPVLFRNCARVPALVYWKQHKEIEMQLKGAVRTAAGEG
jgi:hypothetical protein